MDIKVVVEGVARELCGVTSTTTCEEIIFKLAQAASLPGFYTLVAKHRGGENTLSPEEKILDYVRRIGEKLVSVQFILRRLEAPSPRSSQTRATSRHNHCASSRTGSRNPSNAVHPPTPSRAQSHTQKPNQGHCGPPWPSEKSHISTTSQSIHQHRRMGPLDASRVLSYDSNRTGESDFISQDSESYQQLEDQLASHEQQVELNRLRLLRLDKEIVELERSTRLTAVDYRNELTGFAVGPAAELTQLAATPWPHLLETNRNRNQALVGEREAHRLALERVNGQIVKSQSEASQFENRVAHEVNHLLVELESANRHRRQLYRALSPTSSGSAPNQPSHSATNGVPV